MTPIEDVPVQAVLFDADGVLQRAPHDWVEALDTVGGTGFADHVFTAEGPALRGEASMRDCLAESATSHCVDVDEEELLQLWRAVDVDEDALRVVDAVRRAGVPVYLATNQQDVRRDHMRPIYDSRFDESFYSCELGAAKPGRDYFERVLQRLDMSPAAVLFIDDSMRNVEAARACGLRAVLHDPASGASGLREALHAAGLKGLSDDLEVRRAGDHTAMPWRNGGGTTYEVARHPATGDEFGWRISFADVIEPGRFSTFEGIDRVITLVGGTSMRLRVEPADGSTPFEHVLTAAEPFAFAGEDIVDVTPEGATVDFNIMTARGRYEAAVSVLRNAGETVEAAAGEQVVIACLDGEVSVAGESDGIVLGRMDVALTAARVTVSGAGTALVVRLLPV